MVCCCSLTPQLSKAAGQQLTETFIQVNHNSSGIAEPNPHQPPAHDIYYENQDFSLHL